MSDRGALQRRRQPHGHLLSDGHGAEPDGQGRQGDRHRRHAGAHSRPAVRHGAHQGTIRAGADGRGRGGARHSQGPASVRKPPKQDDPCAAHGRPGSARGRRPPVRSRLRLRRAPPHDFLSIEVNFLDNTHT